MRVLVTGYRGFVGKHLVEALDDQPDTVIVGVDRKSGDELKDTYLPPDIDQVFHLAAQTDAYCRDAMADAETNILGTLRLLEQYGSKVVFASSSMVNYPDTPYAISKLAGEQYVRLYGGAIVRFCNLYGKGGHSVLDRFANENPITVYGDGKQRRTYARVSAAVDALMKALPGTTTILKGDNCSVNELAALTGKKVVYKPARQFDLDDAVQLDQRGRRSSNSTPPPPTPPASVRGHSGVSGEPGTEGVTL